MRRTVTIDLTVEDLAAIHCAVTRWHVLHDEEERNGRADSEIFDLEDGFGAYRWLLELIMVATPLADLVPNHMS